MQNQNICITITQKVISLLSKLINIISHPVDSYNHWGLISCAKNFKLAGNPTNPDQTILSLQIPSGWCYNVLPLYLKADQVQLIIDSIASLPLHNDDFTVLSQTETVNLYNFIINNQVPLRWDLTTNQPYAEVNHNYDLIQPPTDTACVNGKISLDTEWILQKAGDKYLVKYVTFYYLTCDPIVEPTPVVGELPPPPHPPRGPIGGTIGRGGRGGGRGGRGGFA
jgi:hypothetical protein